MNNIADGWDNDDFDVEDGWFDDRIDSAKNSHHKNGDSDDGNDTSLEELHTNPTAAIRNVDNASCVQNEQEGWEWNDDVDMMMEDDESQNRLAVPPPPPSLPVQVEGVRGATDNFAQESLMRYIQYLRSPSLVSSLNDILDKELNHAQFALHLCRYFHQRESLREYTLDVEVPRMDYQIMVSDELILTEASEIQQYFIDNPVDNLVDDMLLRAANQSLLADVFPIITGPDKIVRIQFHANAVASQCRLVLDMRSCRNLQVDCTMTISIPSGMPSPNTKLDLAALRLIIHFSPEPSAPFVKYYIDSIRPLLDVMLDKDKIAYASKVIDLHDMEMIQKQWVSTKSYELRDNFLESIMLAQTHAAAGFQSALREIDGVVNVSSKLNLIKQHLVLPSADDILHAENDIHHDSNITGLRDSSVGQEMIHKAPSTKRPLPPPPPCPPPPTQNVANKPKPIIGGLLMSGFTRLAKAASVPDERDGHPVLYRKEDVVQPPSLHQKHGLNHAKTADATLLTSSLDQSTKEAKPSPKVALDDTVFHHDSQQLMDDDMAGDGWSEDGLEDIDNTLGEDQSEIKSESESADRKVIADGTGVDFASGLHENGERSESPMQGGDHGIKPLYKVEKITLHQGATSQNEIDVETLTPELRHERDYLLQKLAEISQVKNDYLCNTSSDSPCINNTHGIIPTRKRFVSRAEILKLREISH